MLAKRKSRTPRALRLTDIRNKLALTQEVLAGKIDVKPGTVAAWESATKATDYYPSTDILARFAALVAKRGKRFEEDCIWLLKAAGTLNADIFQVLDNQRNRRVPARPPKPGEIVSLPFMDAASGYAPGASFVQTIELPASLLRKAGSLVCVHIEEGAELMNSAPFTPGGLLVIDESETDLEVLLEYPPSTPVAVHYARLPNQLPISGRSSPGETLDLSHLRREAEIRVAYAGDAALGPQTKITAEMQKAPGEHAKANEKVNVSGIHVGWLAIEYAGQTWDGAAYHVREGPDVSWCIVLRGAEVRGLWGGSTLDLTKWDQGQGPLGRQSPLADLIIEDVRVLGRVVLWLPEWSPAAGAREENV